MVYQFKPVEQDLDKGLPYGLRLRIIPGTREGVQVWVKDLQGDPVAKVSIQSLEPMEQ
jgi:hypothetical protein